MKSCFMFGHADTPQSILSLLERTVEDAAGKGVQIFYVGCRGSFDHLAISALRAVKKNHPEISLRLVLAYHPAERSVELPRGFDCTFYPPMESVPRRYAIVQANRYMVSTADYIICYVKHIGNTRKLLEYALRKQEAEGLFITNIADTDPL